MPDTEVWGLTDLGSLTGAYRLPVATAPNAGGDVPVSWFAWRDAAGIYQVGGQLGAANGTAALPAVTFSSDLDTGLYRAAADTIGFSAGATERMRLTTTGLGISGAAGAFSPYCNLELIAAADSPVFGFGASPGAGNLGADFFGLISTLPAARVRGFIGTGNSTIGVSGDLLIAARTSAAAAIRLFTGSTGAVERWRVASAGTFQPGADNAYDLGTAAIRVKVIYAATGTINTSDQRDKLWRGGMSEAELRAGKRIAADLGFYQWLAKIAEVGAENARFHFGVRAQAVWAIMADEGLIDPLDEDGRPGSTPYAFLCWDDWPEEAADGQPAGDRFGIRPDQLALFLISAQEARLAALEALL